MIFLALAAVLSVPVIFMPSEWGAWLVCYASFAIIPLMIPAKRGLRMIIAIWITLAIRHALALANFDTGSIISASDAQTFHDTASFIAIRGGANFAPGASFYSSMLSLVYALAGPSLFLGQETSIFAYSLTCVMLSKLMDLLKIERHQVAVILIFGFLPALVLFGASTLRESWQILFFMSAAYFLIRFRLKSEPWSLFLGAAAALAMGFLHNGLLAYALLMLPFVLFSQIGARSSLSLARLVGLSLTGLLLLSLGAAVALKKLPHSESLEAVTQGEALEYAAHYRKAGAHGARAEYGIMLDTHSPLAFAGSAGLLFIYYMLAPFPWQITAGVDLVGAADSWFRVLLLFFAWRAWRSRPPGISSNIHRLMFQLYFSMSALWAMGTINYGTGIRHHLVAIWIPVLLGVPPLLDALDGLISHYSGKKMRSA